MGEIKTYLQGPKLGDFIHGLVVCKYNYDFLNQKADLYITNTGPDRFEMGLEFTYNDLKPILLEQKWVNKFEIHKGQQIDYDLNNFRNSSFLYKLNWIELYFNEFLNGITPPKEYSWIDMPKDESLSNTVLINRSMRPMTTKILDFYKKIIDENKDSEIGFICHSEPQYNEFQLKNKCKLIKVNTLYEFFEKINSCKLYLGNQSGPSAFATAMNVPRIIELINGVDAEHYMKDIEYYSNFKYFKGDFIYPR